MDCKFTTELGTVTVNEDVLLKVAGYSALECYGISISAVAANIIDTVKYKIEHLTGIKVEKVTVSVEDIRV